MKQLLIISGKGGTGKTTLTAAFAALGQNQVLADCDVDAADLHLVLQPEVKEKTDFYGGKIAKIDPRRCRQCMRCVEHCHFKAIEAKLDSLFWSSEVKINPLLCEGCTLCRYICQYKAINIKNNKSGEWFISHTPYGNMVHATLGIGEENSGKLVTQVLKKAQEICQQEKQRLLLVDGPPGIGCPVISAFTGTDVALLVTEPTVSGLHDLERVLKLAEHFEISTLLAINKADLDREMTKKIRTYASKKGLEVVGEIPFDPQIPKAISRGRSPMDGDESPGKRALHQIYINVMKILAL